MVTIDKGITYLIIMSNIILR